MLRTLKKILLLLLVFVIPMALHTKFLESGVYKMGLLGIFALTFLVYIKPRMAFSNRSILRLTGLFAVIVLTSLSAFAFFNNPHYLDELRAVALCMMAFLIGYCAEVSDKDMTRVLWAFAIGALIMSMDQVINNIGGFVIRDLYYTDAKNSVGVVVGTVAIMFAYLFTFSSNKIQYIVRGCVVLLAIVILLTIRARADSVFTMAFVMLVLVMKYLRGRRLGAVLIGLILCGLVLALMPDSVWQFVFNSFTQNREGDLTSGRTERNLYALEFLNEHLLWGNIESKDHMDTVHNYVLHKMYSFGLLYSLPLLILYLTLFVKSVKYTLKDRFSSISLMGPYVMSFLFAVSLVEYTFPFGPGTATLFNFILFGIAIRTITVNRNNLKNQSYERN